MNILESPIYIDSGKESACLPRQEMQKTQVRSLVQEDPLKKEMPTHSSILAWEKIPWTEEPGGLQSMRLERIWHDWAPNTFT